VQIRLGRLDDAERLLASLGLRIDTLEQATWLTNYAYLARGELLVAQKRYEAAQAFLLPLMAQIRQTEQRLFLPDVLLLLHQTLFALGDLDGASAALAEARTISEERGGRNSLWRILSSQRDVAAARGDSAEAAQLSEHARAILESIVSEIQSAELRASFLTRPEVQTVLAP
jgi:hypothetical protein